MLSTKIRHETPLKLQMVTSIVSYELLLKLWVESFSTIESLTLPEETYQEAEGQTEVQLCHGKRKANR